MSPIEKLVAIEEIKQLKARYFYFMDHKDWDNWRTQVWAPDARLEIPEIDTVFTGGDLIVEKVALQADGQVSVHHGHMPIIEITSDTTATGIWAMEDRLYREKPHPFDDDFNFLLGFGHYHESYVRLDCGWRIASTRLTRLRVQRSKVF